MTLSITVLTVVMPSVAFFNCHAEGLYAECHYAECLYAEYRYAQCRGATCNARKRQTNMPQKPILTLKYYTWTEVYCGKHSIVLCYRIIYDRKKFYRSGIR
jgi:hypothetical protein